MPRGVYNRHPVTKTQVDAAMGIGAPITTYDSEQAEMTAQASTKYLPVHHYTPEGEPVHYTAEQWQQETVAPSTNPVKRAWQAAQKEPTVNLTPMTPEQFLASALNTARDFQDTGAAEVDEPPQANTLVNREDMIGVPFLVLNYDVRVSRFDPSKKYVDYEILIIEHPELGTKKLTVNGQWAVEQANRLRKMELPFKATLELAHPEKGKWSGKMLNHCRQTPVKYVATEPETSDVF